MKRVLQISNYYYPNIGGIEQVARDIVKAISKNDEFEQKLICFNETASDNNHICKREETVHETVDGIEIIRCGCITKKASQSISLTFNKELGNVFSNFKPDIVVFHYPNPFEAQFLLKHLNKNVKFILYWHLDIIKQKILGRLFHPQTIKLLERADKVVATSPVYIEGSKYLSAYREKCVVIPNCIDTSRLEITKEIKERAKQIRQENKNKTICFGVGRHIPYKGFTYLILASKYLDDSFRIFIGGKGELTNSLKKEAEGDDKIIFLGRVSDGDLIAYYLAMDIFCFPSITKNEAFGIALAEGMFFSKPAVTFNIPGSGVNYVNLKDTTGLEVPNKDYKAYADALAELSVDKQKREKLGVAAKQRVQKLFLNEQFEQNIFSLLSF